MRCPAQKIAMRSASSFVGQHMVIKKLHLLTHSIHTRQSGMQGCVHSASTATASPFLVDVAVGPWSQETPTVQAELSRLTGHPPGA